MLQNVHSGHHWDSTKLKRIRKMEAKTESTRTNGQRRLHNYCAQTLRPFHGLWASRRDFSVLCSSIRENLYANATPALNWFVIS